MIADDVISDKKTGSHGVPLMECDLDGCPEEADVLCVAFLPNGPRRCCSEEHANARMVQCGGKPFYGRFTPPSQPPSKRPKRPVGGDTR